MPRKLVAECLSYFLLDIILEKRLDISCESSARQTIHMKCQALFFSEKDFWNVVCCSCDWYFKGKYSAGGGKLTVEDFLDAYSAS